MLPALRSTLDTTGTVVQVAAEPGESVADGAVVAVLGAMQEHAVRAPTAGVVAQLLVTVGQTAKVGDLIAVITEEVAGEAADLTVVGANR